MSLFEQMVSLIEASTLENLLQIQRAIQNKQHASYLIGGSVRDLVMGIKPKDYDLTTSMHPLEVKSLFKKVFDTGIKHGTVTVLLGNDKFEVTTYRKEGKYSDGRHPDSIEFGESLEEDVLRRDFTINSIALDFLNQKIIDSQNGLRDIAEKRIQTIGNPIDRFTEDGLRPIRAIRFMAGLDFTIESTTYLALEKTKSITAKISVERFHDEFIKILRFKNPTPGIYELSHLGYFSLFWKLGVREEIFPKDEIALLLLEIDPLYFRIACTFYYLLKEKAFDRNIVVQIFKNLKFSNELLNQSLYALAILERIKKDPEYLHSLYGSPDLFGRFFVSDWIQNFGSTSMENHLKGFVSFFLTFTGKNAADVLQESFDQIQKDLPPLQLKDLKINGNSLRSHYPTLDPKQYGILLKKCLELVLKNPKMNTEEILLEKIKSLISADF
jgi:tRNA nucleotidyltransferase/poly(A) polymerase